VGPDLAGSSIHRSADWNDRPFQASLGNGAGSSMPPIRLNDSQLNALAAFLLK